MFFLVHFDLNRAVIPTVSDSQPNNFRCTIFCSHLFQHTKHLAIFSRTLICGPTGKHPELIWGLGTWMMTLVFESSVGYFSGHNSGGATFQHPTMDGMMVVFDSQGALISSTKFQQDLNLAPYQLWTNARVKEDIRCCFFSGKLD